MSTHLGSIDANRSARNRAQSHTVGVILLTAVIVILMGVFGAVYLGATNERADSYGPLVDAEVNATADRVVVVHGGGDRIDFDELDVVVRANGSQERFALDRDNVSRNDDDRFDPTERFVREHGLGSGEMEVLLIHADSNTVLRHSYLDVPSVSADGGAGGPLVWEAAADWDGATSSTGVVHEAFGDRSADTLSVGAPTADQALAGYWPLDEDGGTTAVDASPNGLDASASQVTVDVDGITNTTAYDLGDQGWAEVGGFPNLDSELTVSAWIRTTDNTEAGQRIFADDESNSGGYAFSLGDGGVGQLRFFSRNLDSVSLDTGQVVENDRWYHVVAVLNDTAGTRQIYVNGTEEASDSYTNPPGTDGGPASIGGETDDGETDNRFDGRIDEVRVYDDALSQTAVGALHETGYNGTLTTGTKTFETALSPSAVSLRNVSVTRPPGTSINVTLQSDPDGDGTFEETSDPIALDGSATYAPSGLASESRQFRLEVSLNSTNPTVTPTVDRLEIGG